MKTIYRIFAYLVAAEVMVQAMMMVFAIAGLGKWVEGGGVLDRSVMEGGSLPFSEGVGFSIHGVNGFLVIPVIALLLVIFSFRTKIPGATRWAGLVLALVVVQVVLGLAGHAVPAVGALHGLNALVLFGTAFHTARRLRGAATQE